MLSIIWSTTFFIFVASVTNITFKENFTSKDNFIFDSYTSLENWAERSALKIGHNTDIFSRNITVQYKKSITDFKGKILKISIDYFNLLVDTEGEESGAVFMYILNRNGITEYYKANNKSYDSSPEWKTMSFIIYSEYSDILSDGKIYFRLEGGGYLYFSNMILEIINDNNLYPNWTIPNNFICQYTNANVKVDKTFLRGVVSPLNDIEKDLKDFKSWHGNVVRWKLTDLDEADENVYEKKLNIKIKELENILQKAEKLKIWIIISLQSPPGGKDENGIYKLLYDKYYFDKYINLWGNITEHFINSKRIYGYDIINEPMNYYGGYVHYLELQRLTIEKIRSINPNINIIVSSIRLNYTDVIPFNYPNIIYTLHYYNPYEYTHQGLENYIEELEYPSIISGINWNKDYIKKDINGFYNFINKYKAKGLIGEFSVIRWAKGNTKYLSDLIEIFEEYGFDWIYRSFRDEQQWDVEYGNDKNNRERLNITDSKDLLLKYLNNNIYEEPEEEKEEKEKEKEDQKKKDEVEDENENDSTIKIILLVIGSIIIIILFFYIFYIIRKKRKQNSNSDIDNLKTTTFEGLLF